MRQLSEHLRIVQLIRQLFHLEHGMIKMRREVYTNHEDSDHLSENLLSVREILSILFERKRSVITVFFSVIFATLFLVYIIISPTYEAKAKIIINLNDITAPILSAGSFVSDLEKLTDFHTQKDIISSVIFAERVVDKLQLDQARQLSKVESVKLALKDIRRFFGDLLGIKKWTKAHNSRAASIEAVNSNFALNSKPESRAFELIYRARNPDEAAITLSAIVDEYIQYHHDSLNKRASGFIEYLEQQTIRISGQLAEAEQALLSFRKKDTINVDDLAKINVGKTTENIGFSGLTDSTEIQDELKLYILKMEEEVRNLSARYAADDPKIVELQKKIRSYIHTVNSIPDRELQLFRLKRIIELNQDIFLLMRKNLEQIRVVAIGQTSKLSRISIVENAQANDTPVSPNKRLLLILSVIMGFVLSITWAFLLYYLDHSIGGVRDIRGYLGLRNLGHLPEFK